MLEDFLTTCLLMLMTASIIFFQRSPLFHVNKLNHSLELFNLLRHRFTQEAQFIVELQLFVKADMINEEVHLIKKFICYQVDLEMV